MANREEIAALLNSKFKELPVADDVVVDDIAQQLDGHPMSDIAFVLREAGRIAVKTGIEYMDKACFEKALVRPVSELGHGAQPIGDHVRRSQRELIPLEIAFPEGWDGIHAVPARIASQPSGRNVTKGNKPHYAH